MKKVHYIILAAIILVSAVCIQSCQQPNASEEGSVAVKKAEPSKSSNSKPILDASGDQVGKPTTRDNSNENPNIKKDASGNQVGTPTTR